MSLLHRARSNFLSQMLRSGGNSFLAALEPAGDLYGSESQIYQKIVTVIEDLSKIQDAHENEVQIVINMEIENEQP